MIAGKNIVILNFEEYDEVFQKANFFRVPFPKLGKVIREKYSERYRSFNAFQGSIFYLFQSLEILCVNREKDKKYWTAHAQAVGDLVRSNMLEKIPLEENQNLSRRTTIFSRLNQLDVDSFFVFARILLDRIPYLLEPFFEGIVTHKGTTPDKRGFRVHLDWFVKNKELVLDEKYLEKIIPFKGWCETNLFAFRDNIIVHPRQFQITSRISQDAQLTRISFDPKNETKKEYPMPIIKDVLTGIIDFLNFLDDYFYNKLK